MSQDKHISAELLRLCGSLRDQQLTEAEAERLSQLLTERPEARRFYLRFMVVTASLESRSHDEAAQEQDANDESNVGLLLQLLEQEQKARPIVLPPETAAVSASRQKKTNAAPTRKVVTAGQYFLGHTLRGKRALLACAAAFLLGAVLIIILLTNAPNEVEPLAEDLPAEPQPSQPAPRVVATLIASVDASWQGTAPVIGGPLYQDQALALSQGFAKLRFTNQAEVILQAPCTIVPVSESTMRISRGRMVGQCYAESSKGFTVYTPTARVVDIGTEFGVYVSDEGTVEAHVFEGEVSLTPITEAGEGRAVSIREGGARLVSADVSLVAPAKAEPSRFVQGMDQEDRDPAMRYAELVKAMQPVVYYRFESLGQDGSVRNEMGGRYAARVFDQAAIESTGMGNAARFSGGYVQVDETIQELSGAEQYAIAFWVRPDSVQQAALITFAADVEAERQPSLTILTLGQLRDELIHAEAKRLRFTHRNPPNVAGGMSLKYARPYAAAKWMHVVGVKDGPRMLLYVNGELAAEADDATPMSDIDFKTRIGINVVDPSGKPNGFSRPFKGLIDEVAIYDKAISKAEAEQLYRESSLSGSEP
ncbi:MAG: LamG-like jellyroll fold domain-containing protein [Planctomycetota bacterium]